MARIMIADDGVFMRMFIKNILTQNGHEVVAEAVDGQDAVNKYAETRPDIVLLDIVMPNLEGTVALRKIMEMDPAAKVVMCSANGQESVVTESLDMGALEFAVKPFDAAKVMDVIGRHI